jgi:PAS domain S-box-containing protein/putative nucleotidyltransferase with HDIG domain
MSQNGPENSKHTSQTDELWRYIFDTPQAGIVVSINGIIRQMNDTAVRMLGGQSSSDFAGKRFHETLISPEYIECTRERERQIRGGQSSVSPMEVRVRHLNGGELDVLISATSWVKDDDVVVESMLIDITPLKQRERLLEAISGLMAIGIQKNFFINTELALSRTLEAMHKLYAEHHNCGYISLSQHESDLVDERGKPRSSEAPLFISYEPLSGMTRQWILERVKTAARRARYRSRLYRIPIASQQRGNILLVPLVLDGEIDSYFFWIFDAGLPSAVIEADEERRNTYLLAALSTIKAYRVRWDNVQKNTDLAILHRATLEIGKMNSLQQIAEVALEILEKEKGWHPSVIRFKSHAGETLEVAAYRGSATMSPEESRARMDFLNRMIDRPGKGMIGLVIAEGKPIRSLDLPSDPHYIETDPGIKYGIYAPIPIEGKVEGAIGVESGDYSFTESDLRLLSSIGEIVGMGVRSLRLIEMLRERVKWLEILHRINQQIGIETKPEELYQILVEQAIEATGAESAALLIYDSATDVLRKAVARGWMEEVFDRPLRPDESISGRIFSSGKPRLSPLVGEDPLIIARNRKLVPPDSANVGVPVVAKGTVLGVFHIAIKAPVLFSREIIELVEMFGSYAGIVIGRMQLIEALRNADRQMQKAYDETLEGWARAIGIRDDETFQHTIRVAKIAVAIGKHVNLDPQAIENLRRGALLHDVGKLGIPDTILRKPSTLNDEETAIMRTHASFGYELLKPIKYLEGALVVPYCHHERWDGTGYPRRLKGEKIPLLARIFAVADVYDAMTSDRPYRPAHTAQEALDYIRSQSGMHFDPQSVEAFLAIGDQVEE